MRTSTHSTILTLALLVTTLLLAACQSPDANTPGTDDDTRVFDGFRITVDGYEGNASAARSYADDNTGGTIIASGVINGLGTLEMDLLDPPTETLTELEGHDASIVTTSRILVGPTDEEPTGDIRFASRSDLFNNFDEGDSVGMPIYTTSDVNITNDTDLDHLGIGQHEDALELQEGWNLATFTITSLDDLAESGPTVTSSVTQSIAGASELDAYYFPQEDTGAGDTGTDDDSSDSGTPTSFRSTAEGYDGADDYVHATPSGTSVTQPGETEPDPDVLAAGTIEADGSLWVDLLDPDAASLVDFASNDAQYVAFDRLYLGQPAARTGASVFFASRAGYQADLQVGDRIGFFLYVTDDITLTDAADLTSLTHTTTEGSLDLTAGWNFVIMTITDTSNMPPTVTVETGTVSDLNAYYDAGL